MKYNSEYIKCFRTLYEVFIGFAHAEAGLARLKAHLDGKNEVTKRTIYAVTLDRKLNEIR